MGDNFPLLLRLGAAERLLAEGKKDLIGVGRAIFKDFKWAQRAIKSFK